MITLLVIILFLIAFIFDAERDTIEFRPQESWFPKSKWWTEKWTGTNPLLKTVLVFFMDGWHFCKTMYLWFLFSAVGIIVIEYINISYWWLPVIVVGLWGLNGLIFETTYGSKKLLILLSITLLSCSTTKVIETTKIDTIKVASPIIEDSLNANTITDTVIISNKVVKQDTVIDVRYFPVTKKFYVKVKPDTITILRIDTVHTTISKDEHKKPLLNYWILGLIVVLVLITIIKLMIKNSLK